MSENPTVVDLVSWFNTIIWRPIDDISRKSGDVYNIYAKEFVDLDSNPTGVLEGFYQDSHLQDENGEWNVGAWLAPVWNMCQDCWDTTVVHPTHYRNLPDAPDSPAQAYLLRLFIQAEDSARLGIKWP